MNFWQKLKKPIMVLAPMADVTDPAFRRIIAKYGKPDVIWTEFVSADGLFLSPVREYCEKLIKGEIDKEKFLESLSNGIGGAQLIKDLAFSEEERPVVAQFFTSKPEMMEKAAELAVKLGFDGIDINMGCPDKSIEKQNAGAKLMTNPKLAQEIILAAKRGVQNYNTSKNIQGESLDKMRGEGEDEGIPVSVKTRIGWNKNELETWLPVLLEVSPAVITIHARTRKELSLVPAQWENIKRAVEIRNNFVDSKGNKSQTLIFGNGDVKDLEDAKKKVEETGCDGVMLGRAIFGNPWLFNPRTPLGQVGIEEKLKVMVEHTKLFEEILPHKSFALMKKHYRNTKNCLINSHILRRYKR
jgi:tRNA-dihydrouridine synthase